ncbi:hypothetical protein c7_L1310 [Megavirus courdo7]|uniref:Uncharacterized protein n=1 Tax=Megavirus courdo7 TaxID=1128135 RepID=H2ECP9_9VIRU|nr:hypothetical protein c7_L1310 [Megavirus courdo7]
MSESLYSEFIFISDSGSELDSDSDS